MLSRRQVTTATAVALMIAALAVLVAHRRPARSVSTAVSATHRDLGVDRRSALVDELIDLAVLEAQRRSRDATMVALSARGVRADGTVDLEAGEPVVVWVVSPTRVRSLSAVRRLEGLREYRFSADGLRAGSARSGLGEGWKSWEPPARPRCRISELARVVAAGGETFSVSAERQPSAAHPNAWRIERAGRSAKLYEMTDCARREIVEP